MLIINEYGRKNPKYVFRAYTHVKFFHLIKQESNHCCKREFGKCKTPLGEILFGKLALEKLMVKNVCNNCPKLGTKDCNYNMSSTSNTYKKKRAQMYGVIFDFKEGD